MVAVVIVLAHIGHWYHALLYLAPVVIVAFGLWYAGRKMPDDELGEYDDGDLDALGEDIRPRP
jgi:hypothetical protein